MSKTCFRCEKEILPKERYTMVALDIPYLNLFFHKDCFLSIKSNLNEFLSQNIIKLYNWYGKINKEKEK